MRERGVQSRRVRAGNVEPVRRSTPPSRNGTNFWQALAIVALIAATAGWTTVAVLALRGTTGTAAVATDSPDPNAVDPNASDSPVPESHDAPDLEALLPASLKGATFDIQSGLGDSILGADAFGTSMTSFLTGAGKTPADLQIAQASPTGDFDGSIGAYRVAGLEATAVRDALIQAWKGDTPGIVVSQVTLGGTTVTKADFGEETVPSFLYIRNGVVFDIESTDQTIATAAIAAIDALPGPGASAAPHASASASPSASAKPAASASPAP